MSNKDAAIRVAQTAAQQRRPALSPQIYKAPAVIREPAEATFIKTKQKSGK